MLKTSLKAFQLSSSIFINNVPRFSTSCILTSTKKQNEKHLKRGTRFFDQDESDIPIFQYIEDKPEKKQGFLEPKGRKNIISQMHKPFRISFGEYEEIREVSCGYGFTVFSTQDSKHRVYGTGFNQDGQIGFHTRKGGRPLEIIIQPANLEIPFPKEVKILKVSCGRAHTLLLGSNGRVLTLGNNAYGQAGRKIVENEDYKRNNIINEIELEENIVDIVAGQDHSLLLSDKGQVFSCGWGADGQTGLGHYNNQDSFALVEGDIKNEKIVKVACRADNVLALNDKGELFGWGNSEYGQFREITEEQQINLPTHLPFDIGRIKDVASGGTVCLALNEDGHVYVWGYGILGKGPNLRTAFKPEMIPATLFGTNTFSPEVRVVGLFAGMDHQAALNSAGDLYIWGKNRNKCLGLGDQGDQNFPMKVCVGGKVEKVSLGVDHSAVIATAWT